MDMLSGERITAAALTDWSKLGQGLHARFIIRDFRAGVRFLSAIGEAGEGATRNRGTEVRVLPPGNRCTGGDRGGGRRSEVSRLCTA